MPDLDTILQQAEATTRTPHGWPWSMLKYDDRYILSRFVKFRAPADVLDNLDLLKTEMDRICSDAGLVPVGAVWKKFSPQGVTGLLLLETSHLAIHTWPEDGIGYLSLASCNTEVEPEPVIAAFLTRIGGESLAEENEVPETMGKGTLGTMADAQSRAELAVSLLERWGLEVRDLSGGDGNVKDFLTGLPSLAEAAATELKNTLAVQGVPAEEKGDVWTTTQQVIAAVTELVPFATGRLRYVLEDVLVWADQLLRLQPTLKSEYPMLKVPDPAFLIARLHDGQTAGTMSRVPRTGRVGIEQVLVNEIQAKPGTPAEYGAGKAWGIVVQDGDPVPVDQFTDGSRWWPAVDPFTRREFLGLKDVFFIPLALVRSFDPPVDVGTIEGRRYGPTIEIERAAPMLDLDPDTLYGWSDAVLRGYARELDEYWTQATGADREATVNAAILAQREGERRGVTVSFSDGLAEAIGELQKALPDGTGTTAPVYPSGDVSGPTIALEDVLSHVRPICLRQPAVLLVGGLPDRGQTENDIDILIRGPLDEATRHVVQFRLGRMFPPDLSQRVQFHDGEEFGGPFTNHVEMYDLWLIPRKKFGVKEMALAIEKADPLLEYPEKSGKNQTTLQYHFRGRSVHADFRIQVDGHLIGWTLALQKAGLPDVQTVEQATSLGRTFNPAGGRTNKPFEAPARVYATPKAVEPVEWLRIAPRAFEAGEVGATAEKQGVIVEVDRPLCEYGIQKPYFHEYFLTKAKNGFEGLLLFRLLVGEGGPVPEEEAGRQTPSGEPFWTAMLAKTLLPSVLRTRSVETKAMPPDGQSAMPGSLMRITPPEFQFWKHRGAKARAVRDALVASGFFTEDNVVLVNGEFARVEKKTVYRMDERMAEIVGKLDRLPYVLSYQWWKGQTVVRGGPSREEWHLSLDTGGDKITSWAAQDNPLKADRTSAVLRSYSGDALLTLEGDVNPGESYDGDVLNTSKDTPSRIDIIDQGKATLLEDSAQFKKIEFDGGQMSGVWVLRSEADDLWILERSGGPGSARP